MLFVSLLAALGSLMLASVLSDFQTQIGVISAGRALSAHHAIAFSVYYRDQRVSALDADFVEQVSDLIERGDAYATVINNATVGDQELTTQPSAQLPVVLIGAAVQELFPNLPLCSPAPCGMRGADLDPAIEQVASVGRMEITAGTSLPRNAVHFDVLAGAQSLDNRLLLRLPPRSLVKLSDYGREEAITRTVLLDPSPDVVDSFVLGASRGGLYLVPLDLATKQPLAYRNALSMAFKYILGVLSFLAIILVAFTLSAVVVFEQSQRELVIRRAYGASARHIAFRGAAFIAVALVAMPLLAGLVWVGIGRISIAALFVTLLPVVTLGLVLWIALTVRVSQYDPVFLAKER